MMVSEKAVDMVIIDERLADAAFYRERHRIVYRAIRALNGRGEPVDALTVTEHLTQSGELAEAGGRDAVVQLARRGVRVVSVPATHGQWDLGDRGVPSVVRASAHVYNDDSDIAALVDGVAAIATGILR